jgi:hypothetical protein
MKEQDEYLTMSEIAKRFPAFSENALRWHRYKNTNNFNCCIMKIGSRKILISLKRFNAWLDSAMSESN